MTALAMHHTTTVRTKRPVTPAVFLCEFIRISGNRLGRLQTDDSWMAAFKRLAHGDLLEGCAFRGHGYGVIVTLDDTDRHGVLLHASISLEDRYPTWEEIKQLKRQVFGPDMDVMQVIPKDADYVNIHPNTFHLWQTPEAWGVG